MQDFTIEACALCVIIGYTEGGGGLRRRIRKFIVQGFTQNGLICWITHIKAYQVFRRIHRLGQVSPYLHIWWFSY